MPGPGRVRVRAGKKLQDAGFAITLRTFGSVGANV
jgi:hypothetical protein